MPALSCLASKCFLRSGNSCSGDRPSETFSRASGLDNPKAASLETGAGARLGRVPTREHWGRPAKGHPWATYTHHSCFRNAFGPTANVVDEALREQQPRTLEEDANR